MLYLLSFIALAAIPMALGAYGGNLAAIMIPEPKPRARAMWIVWSLAAIGVLLAGAQQALVYKADKTNEERQGDLRGRMSVMTDMLMHPPSNPQLEGISIAVDSIAKSVNAKNEKSRPSQIGIKQQAIVSQPNIVEKPADTGERVVPVTALTTSELRTRTVEWARKMRDFSRVFGERKAQREAAEIPMSQILEANQQAEWQRRVNEDLKQYREREQDFKQVYLGTALALRDELIKRYIRVGAVPPKPARGMNAVFDDQTLAGPDAIGDAATYLEQLARELPDK
jgi:hypothetical protein